MADVENVDDDGAHHTISGNILLFQIHQKLRKVAQRMLFANFVTKSSVDAVLPEQQPTFWGVQYSVLGQQML